MGATQAKNSANAIVNAGISVINESTQHCKTGVVQWQSINCECPDCDISHIKQEEYASLNIQCYQDAAANDTIKQNIKQSIEQEAKAISAGLGTSGTEAQNIINAALNVSTAITNSFSQIIQEGLKQSQAINAWGPRCEHVKISYVEQKEVADIVTKGIQKTSAVADATQNLSQTIRQTATAVSINLLLLIILAVIVVIIIAYFTMGKQSMKYIIPIVLVLAGLYFGLAYYYSWPPFHLGKKKSSK